MQLLPDHLDLRFEEFSGLGLTVLHELRFELLTAPGDAFAQQPLIVRDVLSKGALFEDHDALLSRLLVPPL